jgi:signal transduction histidine kinase
VIRIAGEKGALAIDVTDDGVGGATAPSGGGLVGLADRIAALGGTFVIASPVGRGTTLTVRIPLVD